MEVEGGQVVDRLFDLAVALTDLMNQRLAETGLSPARGGVVWLLHRHGELTQRELSTMLRCTPRNVTGLVDALEGAGLVVRARHPGDRRALLVSLTAQGADLARAWAADREAGAAMVFADTSRAELATFAAVLDRVLTRLRAPGP